MKRIDIGGQILTIPNNFQLLNSMPNDPKDSVVYGMQNDGTRCYVMIYPIYKSHAMPFDTERISKGIHAALGKEQGLIDIRTVQTKENFKSVYSIVKTLRKPSGVQYNLTLQIAFPDRLLHVQGYFEETGTTGQRDANVYMLAVKKGLISEGSFDGWIQDPFDKEYRDGVLKNLSEDEEYDAMFPNHPLTVLRDFVRTILETAPETKPVASPGTEPEKTPEITPETGNHAGSRDVLSDDNTGSEAVNDDTGRSESITEENSKPEADNPDSGGEAPAEESDELINNPDMKVLDTIIKVFVHMSCGYALEGTEG